MNSTITRPVRPAVLEPCTSMAVPEPPALALDTVLQQLQAVVRCLRDEQYAQRPVGGVDSSIGSHVRHCLDHVAALLAGIDGGTLDYDRRERGTAVETDRSAALDALRILRVRLDELDDDVLDRPITLRMMMTCDGAPIRLSTTACREMAYVLSHTIHHHALIGVMVKYLGGWLPDRFGYAPATVAHLKAAAAAACAR